MIDIIERPDIGEYLISMTPVEKIVEMGHVLGFDENSRKRDLAAGKRQRLQFSN